MKTWVVSCSCSFAILIWMYFQVSVTLHQPWLPLTIHPIQDLCEIIHWLWQLKQLKNPPADPMFPIVQLFFSCQLLATVFLTKSHPTGPSAVDSQRFLLNLYPDPGGKIIQLHDPLLFSGWWVNQKLEEADCVYNSKVVPVKLLQL